MRARSPASGHSLDFSGEAEVDVLSFVVDGLRERIVVLDGNQALIFQNLAAKKFLERYDLPEEISSLTARIFEAIALQKTAELFPGQICFSKEIGARRWVFRVVYRTEQPALVGVYFSDESVSSGFDLNALRQQYRITRRESDLLRHLLDGMSNLEIAAELCITVQTVKDHLSNVYRKFGVKGRYALLRSLLPASRRQRHQENPPLPG